MASTGRVCHSASAAHASDRPPGRVGAGPRPRVASPVRLTVSERHEQRPAGPPRHRRPPALRARVRRAGSSTACSPGSTARSARPSSTRAARCSSWPAPGRARPACSPTASPTCSAPGTPQPGEILAITFTNKAAGEMKERVAALVGPRARAMWVSTFHSMCVRILRAEAAKLGLKSSFTIYDQGDSVRLMTMVARDLDLDAKRYPGRSLAAQVSNLKNELIDEESYVPQTAPEKVLGRGLQALPAAAAPGARDGLRRPDHEHRAPAAGVPRRRRALPPPVPARAGRRVPGHQPRPVHAGPRAGRRRRAGRCRRPSCASSATPTSRSTPSAARRSATSTSSSATTRTRPRSCWSRTTAPPSGSCARPTRSSPRTPAAVRRTCGPTPATAS